jgi:hypothetical protein
MSGKYPKMASFNGSMKLKICEAVDLKPTDCATRLQMGVAKAVQLIDRNNILKQPCKLYLV